MTLSRANAPSDPAEERGASESAPAARLLLIGSGGLFALLLVAATLLWVKNGTSVFFETLSAGLAACF